MLLKSPVFRAPPLQLEVPKGSIIQQDPMHCCELNLYQTCNPNQTTLASKEANIAKRWVSAEVYPTNMQNYIMRRPKVNVFP